MHGLERGIHRFDAKDFGDSAALLAAFDSAAEVLLVTCSDLYSDKFGLLGYSHGQVLQNFGNVVKPVDPNLASDQSEVEAVVSLTPIGDIVILGHLPCGLFDAILNPPPERLPSVSKLLSYAEQAQSILSIHYSTLQGRFLKEVFAQENVLVQLENLRTLPSIAALLSEGRIHLHGWLYTLNQLFVYSPLEEQFLLLAE